MKTEKVLFGILVLSLISSSLSIFDYSSEEYFSILEGNSLQIVPEIEQSYVNKTKKEISTEKNSFSVNVPASANTFLKSASISVDDILVDDVELVLEDGNFSKEESSNLGNLYFTSFSVKENCFLSGAEFYFYVLFGDPEANIYLFPSVWGEDNSTLLPDIDTHTFLGTIKNIEDGWNGISFEKTSLNSSNTSNKTWFLGLRESTDLSTLNWGRISDSLNGDNSTCYMLLDDYYHLSVDYGCKLSFSPRDYHPSPEDIDLTINGIPVSSGVNSTQSQWELKEKTDLQENEEYSFTFESPTHNFYCNLTEVDLTFSTECPRLKFSHSVAANAELVSWSSSNSSVSGFESNFTRHRILFSVPRSFKDVSLFLYGENNTENKINFTREYGDACDTILPRENIEGSYFIRASSNNVLTSLAFYKGDEKIVSPSLKDDVNLSLSGRNPLGSGQALVKIFQPIQEAYGFLGKLNFSLDTSKNYVRKRISINEYVSEKGEYIFQGIFINSTDIGFVEKREMIGQINLNLGLIIGVGVVAGVGAGGAIGFMQYKKHGTPTFIQKIIEKIKKTNNSDKNEDLVDELQELEEANTGG